MSRYSTKSEGRDVSFGLDFPTGGFFINETYSDEEIVDGLDELAFSAESLTLSELSEMMLRKYGVAIYHKTLVDDIMNASYPTALQVNVSKIFGKDLGKMIDRVTEDLVNWRKK